MRLDIHIQKMELHDQKHKKSISLIKDIQFSLEGGDTVSLIGPSGSGKTTLLRIIAGLHDEYEGKIDITGVEAKSRDERMQYVFQDSFLLPWLNVKGAIKFAKSGIGKVEIDAWLDKFKILDKRESYPKTLSGGEQARVALAMSLIKKPAILLLDEPFHSLDIITKLEIQEIIKTMVSEHKIATIVVSHDINDAINMSNRILILKKGPLSIGGEFKVSEYQDKSCLMNEITECLKKFKSLQNTSNQPTTSGQQNTSGLAF